MLRICSGCFRKFMAQDSEWYCSDCDRGKEDIISFPLIHIQIPEKFVHNFEVLLDHETGDFMCHKYKLRLSRYERYTFGMTVYDHRSLRAC